jgi:hypothetical protein
MKIIVSHDVDHLTVWEHSYDLVLPKFLVRAILEYGFNKISLHELIERLKCFRANKWENIAELMAFNKAHHIPATFFLGVAHGKGMCYSLKNVEPWINRIRSEGFHAGLHGVAYNSESAIQKEHRLFKEISGTDTFGIRMHYLRNDPKRSICLPKLGMHSTRLFTIRQIPLESEACGSSQSTLWMVASCRTRKLQESRISKPFREHDQNH